MDFVFLFLSTAGDFLLNLVILAFFGGGVL